MEVIRGIDSLSTRYIDGRVALVTSVLAFSFDGVDVVCSPKAMIGRYMLFETDGGTIPRALWSVYNPWGVYLPAYILHDYAWSNSWVRNALGFSGTNAMLESAIKSIGEHLSIRTSADAKIISSAVNLFGKCIWNNGAKHVDNLNWHYRMESTWRMQVEN